MVQEILKRRRAREWMRKYRDELEEWEGYVGVKDVHEVMKKA